MHTLTPHSAFFMSPCLLAAGTHPHTVTLHPVGVSGSSQSPTAPQPPAGCGLRDFLFLPNLPHEPEI